MTDHQDRRIREALAVLAGSKAYRVLSRIPANQVQYRPAQGRVFRGAVLDVETTGLALAENKIIEIGIVSFEYNAAGIVRIVDVLDEMEDPGMPLRPEITDLTGITDQTLAGKTFDRPRILEALGAARFIIAHNAGFDRPFIEREFPDVASKPWACSQTQIPWTQAGMSSARLEYLVMRHGFFYDAHRAETDCRAALHLLAQPANWTLQPGEDRQIFSVLRENAARQGLHIWLVDLPFEKKDQAKGAGYLWSDGSTPGQPKAWHKEITTPAEAQEALAAISEWYRRKAPPVQVTLVTPGTRFSRRHGRTVVLAEVEKFAAGETLPEHLPLAPQPACLTDFDMAYNT